MHNRDDCILRTLPEILNEYVEERGQDIVCNKADKELLEAIASYTNVCFKLNGEIEVTNIAGDISKSWKPNDKEFEGTLVLRDYVKDLLLDRVFLKTSPHIEEKLNKGDNPGRLADPVAHCIYKALLYVYKKKYQASEEDYEVLSISDPDTRRGYLNNVKEKEIQRVRLDGDAKVVEKRVWKGAITKLTVYVDPLGGLTKYEIVWESNVRHKPLVVGPASLE